MNHADTCNNNLVVLVTGANSLLGTHIVERLLSEGYRVKGLLRDKSRFHLPPHPLLTLTEGDFTDADVISKALQGCGLVIHVAACTDQGIAGYDHYRRINVGATRRLALSAAEAGVKRFVYVSTANCFGFGSKEAPGNETLPARPPFTGSGYARSKMEAQQMLSGIGGGMEIVTVNPTFMLGAYDAKPGSGRIILMAYGRRVVFCPPGGKNFINARDAACGVVAALERGKNGEAYLLSGENLSYLEFYRRMAVATGGKYRYIVLPRALLLAAGGGGNILKKMNIGVQFTMTNMKILCIGNYYTNRKAARELGLETGPIEQGISEAVAWFKASGMINNA